MTKNICKERLGIYKKKKTMKIFKMSKNNSKRNISKDKGDFVDIDYLLDNGYTQIPKSKIDSVVKDLGRDYPYIAWGTNQCDIVGVDDFDSHTIIFPFKDKDNNGIYLNEDLKLFFSYKNTISINDIRNRISTLVK